MSDFDLNPSDPFLDDEVLPTAAVTDSLFPVHHPDHPSFGEVSNVAVPARAMPESFSLSSKLVLPALDQSDEVSHEPVVNPVPVGQSVDVSSSSPDKMNQSPVFAAEAIFDFLAPTATPALPNHLESPLLDTSSEDLDNQLLLDRTVAGKEPHRVSRRRVNERWFNEPRGKAVGFDLVGPSLPKRSFKPPQRLTASRLGLLALSGSSSSASDGIRPVFSGCGAGGGDGRPASVGFSSHDVFESTS